MTVRAATLTAIVTFGILTCTPFTPAHAEHMTLVGESERGVNDPPRSSNLDVTLKFGLDGFRLGGRLFGERGVAGLWLNGERRPNGFVLDGRLQSDGGRAFNFKIDAETMDAATRAAWQWFLGF